jgi:CrcB protein
LEIHLQKVIAIAIAGAIGTLARYWLGGLVQERVGGNLPLGTFTVNILGSLLFGLVWSLAEGRAIISAEMRTVILVGFMGAFTTFSTFMFDTHSLLRDSGWLLALGNVTASVIVGMAALFVGMAIGRLF